MAVRGQYGEGHIGTNIPAYRTEANVRRIPPRKLSPA
jgi:glucose-6-phosphate 1-dehydrogenase